ncbi:MAG: phosphoribosyltransferase [Thermoproteota archaeon]
MNETEFETPSWDYFYQLCLELGEAVKRSGYRPEILLGISRGGLIPLRILSDVLPEATVATVRIEFYQDIAKTMQEPRITQQVSVDVKRRKVLIVDDVADTGKSLAVLKEDLKRKGSEEVRIATVYYKPWSIVKPEYYVRESKKWIIFPHERRETVFKLASSFLDKGRSLSEVEYKLVECGFEPLLVKRFLREFMEEKINHHGRAVR